MEQFTVYEERVCLEFNQKDPDGVNEYLVDFAPLLNENNEFAASGSPVSVEVEIEAAGTAESPISLTVSGVTPAPGITPTDTSPPLNTAVNFWLSDGTDATRYMGKITATATATTSGAETAQVLVKRFLIVVEGYTAFGSPDDEKGSPTMSPDPHHHWSPPW